MWQWNMVDEYCSFLILFIIIIFVVGHSNQLQGYNPRLKSHKTYHTVKTSILVHFQQQPYLSVNIVLKPYQQTAYNFMCVFLQCCPLPVQLKSCHSKSNLSIWHYLSCVGDGFQFSVQRSEIIFCYGVGEERVSDQRMSLTAVLILLYTLLLKFVLV